MNLWDNYKLNLLPEEQRTEAIKELIKVKEETERSRLNSKSYQIVRGITVGVFLLAIVVIALVIANLAESWKEVKLKSITPVVCPIPPPCPAATLPKFNIKVSQILEEKKEETVDAGVKMNNAMDP